MSLLDTFQFDEDLLEFLDESTPLVRSLVIVNREALDESEEGYD